MSGLAETTKILAEFERQKAIHPELFDTLESWLSEFVFRNRPELMDHFPFILIAAQEFARKKLFEAEGVK